MKKNAALLHFLAFLLLDHNFGVLRGERLAAKTMAASLLRKPARAVIRRWGEHCSLPSFATLNCGPLLATPQSPKAGLPRFRK